jgi:hypothetical protein
MKYSKFKAGQAQYSNSSSKGLMNKFTNQLTSLVVAVKFSGFGGHGLPLLK